MAGVYHLTAAGQTSWYGFAKAILEVYTQSSAEPLSLARLLPIPTVDYPTPAARPAYSVLSNDKISKALALELPHWSDQLKLALSSML
jgi:dTDP-4-dehydrorhamnose reductase